MSPYAMLHVRMVVIMKTLNISKSHPIWMDAILLFALTITAHNHRAIAIEITRPSYRR